MKDDLPWEEQTSQMYPRPKPITFLKGTFKMSKIIINMDKLLITRAVNVKSMTVDEAPIYPETTKLIKLTNCLVVEKGTVEGQASVDLQMVDSDGNKYLVMTTGAILESLGRFVAASRKKKMN